MVFLIITAANNDFIRLTAAQIAAMESHSQEEVLELEVIHMKELIQTTNCVFLLYQNFFR